MAHLHLKLSLISKVINGKETVYKRGKVRKTIIRNFLHNSVLNIFFKSGGSHQQLCHLYNSYIHVYVTLRKSILAQKQSNYFTKSF